MKASILLIENNCGIPDSSGLALRTAGYDVTLVSNGQEAIQSLLTPRFDLVILDLDMLVSGGRDSVIQFITISLSLPLIIITANPEQQQVALKHRVAASLEKPLDHTSLLAVTERVLAGASNNREQPTQTAHL